MLCNLTDVKDYLGITTTEKDSMLTLIIKQVSALIESYVGIKLARTQYTEELHSVNNNQLLKLNNTPIQSVTSVKVNGAEIDDWKLLPEYKKIGFLYRGDGWNGAYYTRGMTYDPVAGAKSIEVTYYAGYYLPNDSGYVEGAEDSLPYDIITACMTAVVEQYQLHSMGAEGLKSHSEGGISDTWNDGDANMIDGGLSKKVASMLSGYKQYGVA